jgi:hypothetical protein
MSSIQVFAFIGCIAVAYVSLRLAWISFRLLINILIRATDRVIRWVETWKD